MQEAKSGNRFNEFKRRSLDFKRRQLTDSKDSICSRTDTQARITAKQTDLLGQTFLATHRPRLVIRDVRLFHLPAPLRVTWRVANTGAAEAHTYKVEVCLTVFGARSCELFATDPRHIETFNLPAGETRDMEVAFSNEVSQAFLAHSADASIYFESYMAYRSTQDRSYQMQIVQLYDHTKRNLLRVDYTEREYND